MEIIIMHNYFKQQSKDEHGEIIILRLSKSLTPTAPSDWCVFLIPKKNRFIRVNRSGIGLIGRGACWWFTQKDPAQESFILESNYTDH